MRDKLERTIIIIVDKTPEVNLWGIRLSFLDKTIIGDWERKLHKKWGKKIIMSQGIDILISYFKKNKRNFFIRKWVTKRTFKRLIKDPLNTKIYIFGHGDKHSLKFENENPLEYIELKDYPKKDFIGQYHCNAGGGKSLVEYLAKKGDVTNWYRFSFTNRNEFDKLCNQMNKAPDEAEPSDYDTIVKVSRS